MSCDFSIFGKECTVIIAMTILPSGTILQDRYRVEAVIGSGGYATVYRIYDRATKLQRAMKEVVDSDTGIREQFALESKLLMTSNHPNIPKGHDTFIEFDRTYLVMDLVEGQDLEQLLHDARQRTGLPLAETAVIQWIIPICQVLELMHSQNPPIIHRDIKPANIKLNAQGIPVLIDFGLAKWTIIGSPTKQAAQGVTPGFAPPEQYLAQGRTDARSDIYSLGATMYTLITGREPPEAPDRLIAASGNTGKKLIPVRFFNASVSSLTAHIVERAMDIHASNRYQSVAEMHHDLEQSLLILENGDHIIPSIPTMALPEKAPISVLPLGNNHATSFRMPKSLESLPPVATPFKISGRSPFLKFEGPLVQRMGRVSVVLSAVEMFWGLLCAAALAGTITTNGFTDRPPIAIWFGAVIWLGIAIMLGLFYLRVLERPIMRRGLMPAGRRWIYGVLLLFLWVAVNIIAFASFSALSLTVIFFGLGFLSLASILTSILTMANTLG